MCSQNHTGPGIPKGSKSMFTTHYEPGRGKKKKKILQKKQTQVFYFIILLCENRSHVPLSSLQPARRKHHTIFRSGPLLTTAGPVHAAATDPHSPQLQDLGRQVPRELVIPQEPRQHFSPAVHLSQRLDAHHTEGALHLCRTGNEDRHISASYNRISHCIHFYELLWLALCGAVPAARLSLPSPPPLLPLNTGEFDDPKMRSLHL